MNTNRLFLSLFSIMIWLSLPGFAQKANTLTAKETKEGWRLLFDGESFKGWQKLANAGWEIQNGELIATPSKTPGQMDLLSDAEFGNFELYFEFQNYEETNSGIKYLVRNTFEGYGNTYLGLEYQILDDQNFKYPERGLFRSTASLYDLIPAENKNLKPIGEWNSGKIVVNNERIEHWLNGIKTVVFDRNTQPFRALIVQSKYVNMKNLGMDKKGHILLQNEGSKIAFRNIKIKSK